MRLGNLLGLATGLVFAGTLSASATTLTFVSATCDGVASSGDITCGSTVDRRDVTNATDGGNDEFFSLGIVGTGTVGGNIIFSIAPGLTEGTAAVIETTFGSGFGHAEEAEVWVSNDADVFNTGTNVGTVGNGKAGANGTAVDSLTVSVTGGPWAYIGLRDISRPLVNGASSGGILFDGFDLDSITLSAVPVPASVLLLGAAVVGLGAFRRKA